MQRTGSLVSSIVLGAVSFFVVIIISSNAVPANATPIGLNVTTNVVGTSTPASSFNTVVVDNTDTPISGSPAAGSSTGDGFVVTNGDSYVVSETAGPGVNLSDYTVTISGDCGSDGNVTIGDTQAQCTITDTYNTPTPPPAQTITVIASKVVCQNESDLPARGAGGFGPLTSTTATDWVQSHESCSLASGWTFEYGDSTAGDAGDATIGAASGYTDVGTTDDSGSVTTTIPLSALNGGTEFHLREELQAGFIPFTYDAASTTPNGNPVSAQFYCANDVLNYDNWDFIRNPVADTTYYCVAFNAPIPTVVTPPSGPFTVTIDKYLDNEPATAESANSTAFPMVSSWNATNLGGAGNGTYTLSPTGFNSSNAYEAITSPMDSGSSYTTNEDTSGDVVGSTCDTDTPDPYALVGYSTGATLQDAVNAGASDTVPDFTNLTQNEYVVVWNESCGSTPPPPGSCTIVSDTNTFDTTDGHAAVLVTPLNPAWTATSTVPFDPTAMWIWGENPATGTDVSKTEVFTRTFDIVGTPDGGSVDIGADNGFVLKVNGTTVVDDSAVENNFSASQHFDISSDLQTGENTIEVDVTNLGVADSDGSNNPAGTVFQVNLPNNDCSTDNNGGGGGETPATLTIVKNTSNSESNGTFTFNVATSTEEGGTESVDITTTDGTGQSGSISLDPGNYSVTELIPSGWNLSNVSCVYNNDSEGGKITNGEEIFVDSGDTVTCTFDNTASSNVDRTIVVHQGDLTTSPFTDTNSWFFYNDQTNTLDNTLGSFVDGPATAPLGDGSAQISATSTQGILFATLGYEGLPLSQVTSLKYSTYRSIGDSALALALQFDINPDITVSTSTYDGRLVYEPYYTHTVSDNTWQTWDTQDDSTSGGNGNWWFSKAWIATESGCSQATPCTWTQILAAFPNIGISGVTGFKAGSNWSSDFTGNVDDFVIATTDGTNATTTTYDFEPTSTDNGGGDGGGGGGGGDSTPNIVTGGGGG